jgi:hypothetical protein
VCGNEYDKTVILIRKKSGTVAPAAFTADREIEKLAKGRR